MPPPPTPNPNLDDNPTTSISKTKPPTSHLLSPFQPRSTTSRPIDPSPPEMAEEVQRQARAAQILGSYELLVWYGRWNREVGATVPTPNQKGKSEWLMPRGQKQSIPQTRRRFQKELVGMDPDDPAEVVVVDEGEVEPEVRESEMMKARKRRRGAVCYGRNA